MIYNIVQNKAINKYSNNKQNVNKENKNNLN